MSVPSRLSIPLLLLLLVPFAAGCGGGGETWPPQPARVDLGADACAGCRMIVSDARWAAQHHARGGSVEFFDDLGCLLEKHGGPACDPSAVFVHAFEGDDWLRGDAAHVVRSDAFASPMGFGLAAFPAREQAEAETARRSGAAALPLSTLLREGTLRSGSQQRPGEAHVSSGPAREDER